MMVVADLADGDGDAMRGQPAKPGPDVVYVENQAGSGRMIARLAGDLTELPT